MPDDLPPVGAEVYYNVSIDVEKFNDTFDLSRVNSSEDLPRGEVIDTVEVSVKTIVFDTDPYLQRVKLRAFGDLIAVPAGQVSEEPLYLIVDAHVPGEAVVEMLTEDESDYVDTLEENHD